KTFRWRYLTVSVPVIAGCTSHANAYVPGSSGGTWYRRESTPGKISPFQTEAPVGESLWMSTLCGMLASLFWKWIVKARPAGASSDVPTNAMLAAVIVTSAAAPPEPGDAPAPPPPPDGAGEPGADAAGVDPPTTLLGGRMPEFSTIAPPKSTANARSVPFG